VAIVERNEVIAALHRYERELEGILSRFAKDREGHIYIGKGDEAHLRQMVLELNDLFEDGFIDGERHSSQLKSYFRQSMRSFSGTPSYSGVEDIKSLIASAITRVERHPQALKTAAINTPKDQGAIVRIAERLHLVVCQLRDRREDRPTLNVADEYDVQDLVHALLQLYFDDIKPEERTPSHAGASAQMDFLLREIETVVETKMTRPKLSDKQVGDQLILDIARYKEHPECRTLFCLVYDPGKHIKNPRGLENDLNKHSDDRMTVRTMIVPR
jgi:hypothetical protein